MESAAMATAIHIELDVICLLVLAAICVQSLRNVNQQMRRVLFRYVVYGCAGTLALDVLWLLVEGRRFPGAMAANQVINALFLAMGCILGGLWYLYVLETLGHRITRRLTWLVMAPGMIMTLVNLASIATGWVFYITPDNIYMRGPLFWLQVLVSYGLLLVALVHIVAALLLGRTGAPRRAVQKLLAFYIIPVVGSVAALPFSGMPGTWPCASLSLMLLYIDDQDREILRDSLTGLNNRRTLEGAFAEYARQVAPDRGLYLFMLDLDRFKQINDAHGHSVGDQALVNAARVLTRSAAGQRGIIVRFGGDEFLFMGFFPDDAGAQRFRETLDAGFEACNREQGLPYRLAASIGYARYVPGQPFTQFLQAADERLYADKAARRKGA